MRKKDRKKQIQESINLIGFVSTFERTKSADDRRLFDEISEERRAITNAQEDKRLKKAGISF